MSAIVRLRLLDGFVLERDGEPIPISSSRLQALLAFLALHRATPQRRQSLAFLLWPDSSEGQAQTNLRTLLARLRLVVPNIDQVLHIDARSVAWQSEVMIELDTAAFEEALRRAETAAQSADDDTARAALEQAVGAYAGDLLPNCSHDWACAERARVRLLFFGALERLVALLERRRDYGAAIAQARRLVRLDPWNEAALLTLMRLYSITGSRASGLRVYHTYASMLEREAGRDPGAALTSAYERLLASEAPHQGAARAGAFHPLAPLVGRDREWDRALAAWRVAAAGQPRLLVIAGDAGIGKTRLAQQLLDWGGRQGIVTAAARCYAAEGDLAYAPVTSWLRSDALHANLDRLAPEWRGELARLVPESLPKRFVGRPGPLTEGWQRQRLFEALARAVLATGRPIMLLIDDLQWCARDMLDWLHFLLRFEARAHLLLVATVRHEEVPPDHPLTELLNILRGEHRLVDVTLDALSPEETATLAGCLLDRPLDQVQARRLYAETEGNPLFIVETIQDQAATASAAAPAVDGTAPDPAAIGDMDVPPGVRAVIVRRLGQPTAYGRAVLNAAAVIGRSFTVPLLARVAGAEEDDLLAALDELWQRRILRDHGADGYDFTHDKLRVIAYTELSAVRRRTLHRRVAEALAAEHAADLDAVCGQLALHYERAGLPTRAWPWYRRAAAVARRQYANATAVANYRRALLLGGDQPPRVTAEMRDELGDVLHLLGRYDEAQAEWRSALELTPADHRLARAHLLRKLGNASRDQYRYDEALTTYDAAQEALGSGANGASEEWWLCWTQIQLERLATLYWLGRVSEILSLVDQIRGVVERFGFASLRARLYQATTTALLRRDRYVISPETVAAVRAYLGAVLDAGDVAATPAAHFMCGFVALWADELVEAERELGIALDLAERTGDVSLEGRCLTYLTVLARKRDNIERVRELGERTLRVATAARMPDYVGAAHGNLAWAAWRQGDGALARAEGQAALQAWGRLPASYVFEWIGRWPLIGLALDRGDLDEAAGQAQALLDPRQQRPPPPIELALTAAVQAAGRGDGGAARTGLEEAAAAARLCGHL
jgi:DNA-binding SARP family transcriptional activator